MMIVYWSFRQVMAADGRKMISIENLNTLQGAVHLILRAETLKLQNFTLKNKKSSIA